MLLPLLLLATTALARTITLPPGETHLREPLDLKGSARDLVIRGAASGSTLVMDAQFKGSAAVVIGSGVNVALMGFAIRGNRAVLKSDWYLPLKEAAFADFYPGNGILVRNSRSVSIRGIGISSVRAFPVLVSASSGITIDGVSITDSGTLNPSGRNNTTGGILLEEGVTGFEVKGSTINRITGNAIWTHSYRRSPRNARGYVHDNSITSVARDAIQIGHAANVRVDRNRGSAIGYPAEYVDAEHHATPVALDTAGNVDHAFYTGNHFTDVNGECINLDGFHEGEVSGNSCVNEKALDAYPWSHYAVVFGNNDPGMDSTGVVLRDNVMRGFAYGGIFLIGSGHRVVNNRLTRLNLAHCGSAPVSAKCNYALDQPDLLRTGIYLSDNGGRVTRTVDNVIEGNEIAGYGMETHCVKAAATVDLKANRVAGQACRPAR